MNQQIKQRIEQINNGQVPEGYKKTEFGVFPCDWVTKKLDSVCQINPKTNCLPKQFIYLDLESVQDGKIIQKNIINIENAPSRAQRVLSKNDIIYQLVRPYQKNNLFFNVDDEQYPTVASTGYGLLRSKMQNYLFQILHADYFVNQVNVKCTGTNYPAINSDDLGKVLIAFPQSTAEQEKIAEILMKWDKAIELYNQQIDKLNMLKSACIKKMFPKRKSKIPELRFKGFTETWEQRKVSDLFKITRGYVLAATLTQPQKTDITPYPVYSSQTKDKGLMGYYKDFLYEDAITWTTDGANAGTVSYRSGKFYCTNVCGVLLSDNVTANQMIAEALNNVAKGYVSYVGNPKLMNNVMADIEIYIPQKAEEREKISEYFLALDHLITLHQRKVEIIIRQRKALQQYLLNGIVRVEV